MNRKMALAGLLVAVLAFSTLGAAALAQEATDDTAVEQEVADDITIGDGTEDDSNATFEEPNVLITCGQMETIRETIRTMQENHSTRTEIRETARAIAMECITLNLASYGLTEDDISIIQAKLTELWDKVDETADLAEELWAQDMNMADIQAELQTQRNETQDIQLDLANLLEQYGIVMPGPGLDERGPHGGGRTEGPGAHQSGMRPQGEMNGAGGCMNAPEGMGGFEATYGPGCQP